MILCSGKPTCSLPPAFSFLLSSSSLFRRSFSPFLLPERAREACAVICEGERERKRESDGKRTRFAVVAQAYETRVSDEFVIRGNAAILKCSIPSFVADFVTVQAWVTNDGQSYYPTNKHGIVAVQRKDTACSGASFLFVTLVFSVFFLPFIISGVLVFFFSGESSYRGLMYAYIICLGLCFLL